jgi:hypothetical protein
MRNGAAGDNSTFSKKSLLCSRQTVKLFSGIFLNAEKRCCGIEEETSMTMRLSQTITGREFIPAYFSIKRFVNAFEED